MAKSGIKLFAVGAVVAVIILLVCAAVPLILAPKDNKEGFLSDSEKSQLAIYVPMFGLIGVLFLYAGYSIYVNPQ